MSLSYPYYYQGCASIGSGYYRASNVASSTSANGWHHVSSMSQILPRGGCPSVRTRIMEAAFWGRGKGPGSEVSLRVEE